MICLDNTFIVLLFHPDAPAPVDPATGLPVPRIKERMDLLQATWNENGDTIIIPSPALGEFLVFAAEDAPLYLNIIEKSPNFLIGGFNTKEAVELAALYLREEQILTAVDLKNLRATDTRTRLKFDRQIIAIAKSNGAHTIYSDDKGVKAFAERHGVRVVHTWELPLPPDPPVSPQLSLFEGQDLKESDTDTESNESRTEKIVDILLHHRGKPEDAEIAGDTVDGNVLEGGPQVAESENNKGAVMTESAEEE